jgi:ATP-dependent Lon protease
MTTQSIPFMSLRGASLFPGNPIPLEIGRAFTMASIKESIASFDRNIVVSSQRMVEMNDQPDLQQVFNIGCLCRIGDHVEFPDGHMKTVVIPERRFIIDGIKDADGVRYCAGKSMPDFAEGEKISPGQKQGIELAVGKLFASKKPSERISRLLEKLKQEDRAYEFIMNTGFLLGLTEVFNKELTLEQINEGIFVIDTYTPEEKALINMGVARIQEVLAAPDAKTALKKIETLVL